MISNKWLLEHRFPIGSKVRIVDGSHIQHISGNTVDLTGLTGIVLETGIMPVCGKERWFVGMKFDKTIKGYGNDDTADLSPDFLERI